MKLGEAYVAVKADLKGYGPGLDKARGMTRTATERIQKRLDSINFKRAGLAAAAFGGIATAVFVKVMKDSVRAANEQEAVEKRLESVIKSTGNAAGFTAQEMFSMAAAFQKVTTVGDEVIIAGQAILATFKEIRGDAFEKTMMAALDMSEVMQQDLRSSVVMLGKALNDPIANLSALSRSGVQFTKEQKETIKTLWNMGKISEAQVVILKELESQFGGAAKAARDRFGGAAKAASNALGDLKEEIGFTITKSDEFIDVAKGLEQSFIDATKWVKDHREQLAGVATIMTDWVETSVKFIEKNLPGYIESITIKTQGIIDMYNKLPDGVIGAAGTGIIGRILIGKGGWLAALAHIGYQVGQAFVEDPKKVSANIDAWQRKVESLNHTINELGTSPEFKDYVDRLIQERDLLLDLIATASEMKLEVKVPPPTIKSFDEMLDAFQELNKWVKPGGSGKGIIEEIANDFSQLGNVNFGEVVSENQRKASKAILTLEADIKRLNAEAAAASGDPPWQKEAQAVTGGWAMGRTDMFMGLPAANERAQEMVDGNKEAADEVTQVYETAASRIRDAFVDAFVDIAMTGKLSMESLGQTFSVIGAQIITQAWITATEMKAALASTGWGIALVAAGAVVSAMSKDKGPSALDKLGDKIDDLTDTLADWTDDLDRSLYLLTSGVGKVGADLYDVTERYNEITDGLASALNKYTKESMPGLENMDIGGFMSWFGENAFAATHHIRTYADTFDDVLDTALGSYSAFLKEVRLLSEDLLGSIKSFSESFFPMTMFDKAQESFKEEFGGLKADTLLILDANETAKTNVATLTASLAEWSAKTAEDVLGWNLADLPGSSITQPTGPGSEFYYHSRQFGEWRLLYDKAEIAWETAEKTIANTIGAISTQLADWKAQLLDPAIEAGYRDFISNEIKYWEAMLEEYQKQRAEIFEGVDRYMGDLLGTTSELDKSLYSVNTQFQSWLDALIDAGGTLAEQTDLMGDWEAALRKTIQRPFEDLLQTVQDAQTSIARKDWGFDEWTAEFNSIGDQINGLIDTDLLSYFNNIKDTYSDLGVPTPDWLNAIMRDLVDEDAYAELIPLFEDQLSALQNIEQYAEQELSALENAFTAIQDLITNISGGGDLAPVSSAEFWTNQYDKLLTDAMTGGSEAITAFEQFVPNFLKFMQAYTPDYKGITDYVTQDLMAVGSIIEDSMSELELLTDTNSWLSDIYDVLSTKLQDIIDSVPYASLDLPGYASGGRASGLSFAAEDGPEWIMPTGSSGMQFLAETGIGAAIEAAIASKVGSAGGGPIQIDMKLYLDGDQIRHSVAAGANGRDVELINAIRRAARG